MLDVAHMKREISRIKSSFQTSTPATTAKVTKVIHPSISASKEAIPSGSCPNQSAFAWSPASLQSSLSCIQQQMTAQQEACMSMAASVRETVCVPKPEILTFDGHPRSYLRFIRCFDANIAQKINDEGLKQNYLIQFCKNEAKEAI